MSLDSLVRSKPFARMRLSVAPSPLLLQKDGCPV